MGLDPESLQRELDAQKALVAQLEREKDYHKRRSDELAGQQLRADSTVSILRHEVRQKRLGLGLLSALHRAVGTHADTVDIAEQTIQGITHRLKMDRALILTPPNGSLDVSTSTISVDTSEDTAASLGDTFRPLHWIGYGPDVASDLSATALRFPLELLRTGGHLLVNGETARSDLLNEISRGLSLPFFVVVPVIVGGVVVALLAAGRLKEAKPFVAPLDQGDVDIFHAIAGYLVDALKDASYRHRLEELVNLRTAELAAARDQALAASRAKSAFVASMSHELRTPLNAIIGYTEMLIEQAEEDEPAPELVPDMQRVLSAAHHLLGLISDVLDLSKIEAGKMDLYLETVSIHRFVDEVVNLVRPVVEKNGNRFTVRMIDEPGELRADITKVRQALVNLLSNAAKFTREGEVTLEVLRAAGDGAESPGGEGERVRFRVIDTGIGMTRQQMSRIFQAFHQADASIGHKFGGTGLGLAISRVFCRMMKGDITVKSEPGRGSVFTIDLPAQVPEVAPAVPEPSSEAPVMVDMDLSNQTTVADLTRFTEKKGYG